jgi:hypothetical protein
MRSPRSSLKLKKRRKHYRYLQKPTMFMLCCRFKMTNKKCNKSKLQALLKEALKCR